MNGILHKVVHINRPKDEITLWDYPNKRRVVYTYSDVKRKMEKAFTLTEVAAMLNRVPTTIHRAIDAGEIETPQHTYGLETGKLFQYMMKENEIMEMHALLQTKHPGPPRKDGGVTPRATPTAREVRAMIRNNTVYYVKTESGFVPTWEAEQF